LQHIDKLRNILVHYHFYKNSGTSIDFILRETFKSAFISFDGPFPFFNINQDELLKIINSNSEIQAISSHQIKLPVPTSLNINFIPIICVRNPLLRVYSIYNYKRKFFDNTETSKNAVKLNFNEWVNHSLNDPFEISHISNTQTRFLSYTYNRPPLSKKNEFGLIFDLNQAKRNIENVKLLLRTEYLKHDIGNLNPYLESINIKLNIQKNVWKNSTNKKIVNVTEKLNLVKNNLTSTNYEKLINANKQDQQIYDLVSKRLNDLR